MHSEVLDQQLLTFRAKIDDTVKELHELTLEIGHQELAQTVSELRNRINEPFMFVIVGEVKAGKSSFINALLDVDKEVCKVAPDPCTDTIQQITYGPTEQTTSINPFLKQIQQPVEILKEITIVDTPGTNTIVENHQQITEDFIPGSDLVVFVFEAKNPYRQSAWDFFDYIHADWRKKTIFVLQQADLMVPADLEINIQGVKSYAQKKGVETPNVFAVSAKLELQKPKGESGFIPLRNYISQNITGGKAPLLKAQNNLQTSQTLLGKIKEGLDTRAAQYEADVAFRQDVKETLADQENRSYKQVDMLVENLIAEYERVTRRTEEELEKGLGFFSLTKRSIRSIFSKEASIQEWLNRTSEQMENDLSKSFNAKLNEGVVSIADSIQQMAKIIDLKLQNSPTILKNNHEIFGNIADRRSQVLRDLQDQFAKFINRTENFVGKEVFEQDYAFSPNIAAGSGIAAVGVVITAIAQATVLDVTGGLLTATGLLFAGITVSFKRRKFMREYRNEIIQGRGKLEEEIEEKLKAYIRHIKQSLDSNFQSFDAMLELEEKQLEALKDRYEGVSGRLDLLETDMHTLSEVV